MFKWLKNLFGKNKEEKKKGYKFVDKNFNIPRKSGIKFKSGDRDVRED